MLQAIAATRGAYVLEQAVQAQLKSMTTRRRVLRGLLWAASAPLVAGWWWLSRGRQQRLAQRRVAVAKPDRDGVSFHGDVILIRSDGDVRALSARCPHLGCRINRRDGAHFVCPCHGSRFDADGTRLSGPASDNLRALTITPQDGTELLDVDLSV